MKSLPESIPILPLEFVDDDVRPSQDWELECMRRWLIRPIFARRSLLQWGQGVCGADPKLGPIWEVEC